jgi:hypothetical protein
MKNPTVIPDTAKFPLGRIVSTPGALDACTSEYLRECLLRHIQGDWGVVSADDAAAPHDDCSRVGSPHLAGRPFSYGASPCHPPSIGRTGWN